MLSTSLNLSLSPTSFPPIITIIITLTTIISHPIPPSHII